MILVKPNDVRVEIFKTMRNRIGEAGDVFIADGEKVVERLLDSNLEVVSIFGLEKYIHKYQEKIKSKSISEDSVFIASKSVMQEIIGFHIHQGLMALARKPANQKLEHLGNRIVVLNGVIGAENVGSIIRSSTAFDANSILADTTSCHPYIRRSVRVSLGSIFNCQVSISDQLAATILELKNSGYRIVGSSSNDLPLIKVCSSYEYKFPEKFALVLGNEGSGITDDILKVCDDMLQIPVSKGVSSLNVASAATALLYQSNSF